MATDLVTRPALPVSRALRVALVALALPASAPVLGCSGVANQLAVAPTVGQVQSISGGKCSLASNQPLAIDWPSTQRGALESKMRHGVAAVRYTGCELVVLDACTVKDSKYSYVGITPKHEVHKFSTADELYAHMPVGAQKLEGSMRSSGHLALSMTLAGRLESSNTSLRADELQGDDCKSVTHFVRAASVGAFRLDTGADATVGGSVVTEKIGVSGSGSAKKEALTADGEESACQAAKETDTAAPRGCGAVIRLELTPVDTHLHAEGLVMKHRVCPPGEAWSGGVCTKGDGKGDGKGGPAGAGAATGRFAVRGPVVFDTTTGLGWQRAPSAKRLSWSAAKAYCDGLTVDGESGFRLPKKSELTTLVGSKPSSPWVDTTAFPGATPTKFWTSSEDHGSPGDAWALDFSAGAPRSVGSGLELDVRCVR